MIEVFLQRGITLIDEQKVRNIHFAEGFAEFCTALLPRFLLSAWNWVPLSLLVAVD
jgi:hypothetical protein